MSDGKNRSVSLPADALEEFKTYAADAGQSLSGWLLAAAVDARARQSAAAYAQFLADPEAQQELSAYRQATAETRAAGLAKLQAPAGQAA